MSYSARVKLITPFVYLIGVLGYVPVWVLICIKTRSYTPIVLGGGMWWMGITTSVYVARELAKEEDKKWSLNQE
jgi:hypothetical protein